MCKRQTTPKVEKNILCVEGFESCNYCIKLGEIFIFAIKCDLISQRITSFVFPF